MPRWLGNVLRLLGAAAGIGWIVVSVDLRAAGSALARVPVSTFAIAVALIVVNIIAGALRWRAVLRAYGADRVPKLGRLFYLYLVALFYNNFLPGAVAGDVGRGVITHEAFSEGSAAASLAVVFVERALGLFALFGLLATGLVLSSGQLDTSDLWWWTIIGTAGSCVLVACLPIAKRLAPYLPKPLAKIAGRIPTLQNKRAFAEAIVHSFGSQLTIALAGWWVLEGVGDVTLANSLLVVPLASATAFLPFTVGGAGAREAVYVTLCAHLFGMPAPDALAASLGLWFAILVVGLAGGIAQVIVRPPVAKPAVAPGTGAEAESTLRARG